MVYQQTQPGEIKKDRKHSKFFNALFDILVMVVVAGATFALFRFTIVRPENQEKNNPDVVNKLPTDDENSRWLQQTMTMWSTNFSNDSHVGMIVYDLDNNSVLGVVNSDDTFYEQQESPLSLKVGKEFSTGNQTTPREMADIAKAVYTHEGMNDDEYKALKDELSIGDGTTNGLPSGFRLGKTYGEDLYNSSEGSSKYRSAIIIEFQTDDGLARSFVVSLLAEHFDSLEEFRGLGSAIEDAIVAHFEKE